MIALVIIGIGIYLFSVRLYDWVCGYSDLF